MSETDTPCDDGQGVDDEVDSSHLEDIDDGYGCAEVWEHLSEARKAESEDVSSEAREAEPEDASSEAGEAEPEDA